MSSETSTYWFAPNMSYLERTSPPVIDLDLPSLSEPEAVATGTVLNRGY
jgi:hypothetical protein